MFFYYSNTLIDGLRIITSEKTGKILGAVYGGRRIIVTKGSEYGYSEAGAIRKDVENFKDLVEKAKIEYLEGSDSQVEDEVGEIGIDATPELTDLVIGETSRILERETESRTNIILNDKNINENERNEIGNTLRLYASEGISGQEVREIAGTLKPKGTLNDRIEALKIDAKHWKERAVREKNSGRTGGEMRSVLFRSVSEICDLQADRIRLKIGKRVESS